MGTLALRQSHFLIAKFRMPTARLCLCFLHHGRSEIEYAGAVGNGAVHPMAAQTIATVRRLLTHPCALEVIFSDAEPSGREWVIKAETASQVPEFNHTA